jgi:dTDP-glucose pyrophosphorylase
MNLWGFKPSCFGYLRKEFADFIRRSKDDPNAELDIPTSMDVFIKKGDITIRVLMTDDKWFGVTYREDKPYVVESLAEMTRRGVYPTPLRD